MESSELRHAYLRPLMIFKCTTFVTSESFPTAYERSRSGIYKMASTSVLLTRRSFYSSRKAVEIFAGAYPVTDRRFNVCFIGTNMLFGLKTSKKNLFISQSNGAFNS